MLTTVAEFTEDLQADSETGHLPTTVAGFTEERNRITYEQTGHMPTTVAGFTEEWNTYDACNDFDELYYSNDVCQQVT